MSGARPGIDIARAAERDAAEIAQLHATLFETPWSAETIALMLARDGGSGLVAREHPARDGGPGGGLAGFALFQTVLDEAEIMSIGIVADRQGQGIGRTLLGALLGHLGRADVRHVHLEVAATNAPARALYAAHGFVQVGLRRGYYATRDGPVDGLLLRVEISRVA